MADDEPERLIRVRVQYSGRVQGVGFRATALDLARKHAVVGFVCNRADGDVELVAEGPPAAVADLLAAVQRALGRGIRAATRSELPAGNPPFEGFAIRHEPA